MYIVEIISSSFHKVSEWGENACLKAVGGIQQYCSVFHWVFCSNICRSEAEIWTKSVFAIYDKAEWIREENMGKIIFMGQNIYNEFSDILWKKCVCFYLLILFHWLFFRMYPILYSCIDLLAVQQAGWGENTERGKSEQKEWVICVSFNSDYMACKWESYCWMRKLNFVQNCASSE
jgi:hypothetical protein